MLNNKITRKVLPIAFAFGAAFSSSAQAGLVDITVTIENLAPQNSVAFAPLRLGFHSGTFDAFNINTPATAAIISVAEGGSGSDWFPAFAAADPNAVLGTVAAGGPALPAANAGVSNPFSATASNTFRVDTSVNQFFTFANMVVPSNDLFLGNDNPIKLFDDNGNLILDMIVQTGASIWDANSEVADPANGAFVVGGNNGGRIAENGLVDFDLSELLAYDGFSTPAGYVFDSSTVNADTEIYRISFSAAQVDVSAPSMAAFMTLSAFGLAFRRFKSRT
ncbi:spondin domain-containing protein [Glaciecola sp. SC05]|uniref:spondin domain-containing protein n=1 Tax=Glaciecola sp. SC05 TaxID=1987355 RepID=UPI0035272F80